jgi:Mg-chelatase subunit ChlD
MDQIVALDLQSRPGIEGFPPRAAIHEALLQLSITDTTEAPLELAETISGAYDLLLEMKKPSATSTDSLRVLARLYRFLEEQLRRFPSIRGEADPLGMKETSQDSSTDPASSPDQRGAAPSPSTLSYRGTMHPDWVRSRPGDKTIPVDPSALDTGPPPPVRRSGSRDTILQDGRTQTATRENVPDPGSKTASTRPMALEGSENPVFFYDEWDEGAQEYRPKWCRLYEHRIQPESSLIVQQTLSSYGPVLRLLRRHFQSLRPEAFRKVKRQTDGENLDLDAVIEARTELRSGRTPQDSLYIRNEKRLRDVAVAFLIDMSGSTSRQIPSARRRVIEVEQEAMILMAEALQAVGDTFAIYGFSGDSKDRVDFYVIKDFSDALNARIHERIGAMRSLNQNRDGTAIRHALSKLEQQPSKTRLLILLSDGKPLDTDYAGAHSLQDTKMALKEARMRGIHPYCITIDKEASRYVTEMYGEVSHTIIDQVATLPDKLPRIYRRLTT